MKPIFRMTCVASVFLISISTLIAQSSEPTLLRKIDFVSIDGVSGVSAAEVSGKPKIIDGDDRKESRDFSGLILLTSSARQSNDLAATKSSTIAMGFNGYGSQNTMQQAWSAINRVEAETALGDPKVASGSSTASNNLEARGKYFVVPAKGDDLRTPYVIRIKFDADLTGLDPKTALPGSMIEQEVGGSSRNPRYPIVGFENGPIYVKVIYMGYGFYWLEYRIHSFANGIESDGKLVEEEDFLVLESEHVVYGLDRFDSKNIVNISDLAKVSVPIAPGGNAPPLQVSGDSSATSKLELTLERVPVTP